VARARTRASVGASHTANTPARAIARPRGGEGRLARGGAHGRPPRSSGSPRGAARRRPRTTARDDPSRAAGGRARPGIGARPHRRHRAGRLREDRPARVPGREPGRGVDLVAPGAPRRRAPLARHRLRTAAEGCRSRSRADGRACAAGRVRPPNAGGLRPRARAGRARARRPAPAARARARRRRGARDGDRRPARPDRRVAVGPRPPARPPAARGSPRRDPRGRARVHRDGGGRAPRRLRARPRRRADRPPARPDRGLGGRAAAQRAVAALGARRRPLPRGLHGRRPRCRRLPQRRGARLSDARGTRVLAAHEHRRPGVRGPRRRADRRA
jgi:hypothetical protein